LIGLRHIRIPSEASQWRRFAQKSSNARKRSKQATPRLTLQIRRCDFADRGEGMAWANKGCKERLEIEITVQLQSGYYKSLEPRL
jgi:hypothetical protein